MPTELIYTLTVAFMGCFFCLAKKGTAVSSIQLKLIRKVKIYKLRCSILKIIIIDEMENVLTKRSFSSTKILTVLSKDPEASLLPSQLHATE